MDQYPALADLGPTIDSLRSRARTGDPQTRFEIMKLAHELTSVAETEVECLNRVCFGTLEPCLALVGSERGIFKEVARSKEPITDEELAKLTHIETGLLARLTRGLATYRMLEEVSPGKYLANQTTHTFNSEDAEMALRVMIFTFTAAYAAMSEWVGKQQKQQQDETITNGPPGNLLAFHDAFHTDKSLFEFMTSPGNEHRIRDFAGIVAMQKDNPLTWSDVFPVREEVTNLSADQVLWVDVGGSSGHRTQQFRDNFPDLKDKGKLIVQDLPGVIDVSPPLEGIEFQPHDFFTPQCTPGAKFYYLRFILHNHPDEKCVLILKNIRDVMAPNSVILIDELIVAEMNNHYLVTQLDMTMLTCLNARERTLQEWKTLCHAAGLKIKSFEVYKPAARNSIMALVAE